MLPTFSEGDVVYMSAYEAKFEGVERGDIVVFGLNSSDNYLYVKRVIGIPGDKIVLREEGVELNGVWSGSHVFGRLIAEGSNNCQSRILFDP